LRNLIKRYLNKLNTFKSNPDEDSFMEIDLKAKSIISKVQNYTMTSIERRFALINAVRYITSNKIAGDIVECGVWKGGSMMAVAYTLIEVGDLNRNLYLYDTFEGMALPTEKDVSFSNIDALSQFSQKWCYSPLEEVMSNIDSTAYKPERVHFIKGRVEETIPQHIPDKIALLRLDTDWYESTKHELEHLFPKLVSGGVIILDDYGHWRGCKQATDEYIQNNNISILLNRIDYTGRIGIKL
jgi:O-methyltransferase